MRQGKAGRGKLRLRLAWQARKVGLRAETHGENMARYKFMSNHPNRNKVRDWSKYLKEYRAFHGFTQKSLADRLQISLRNIENWEEGVSKPPAYLKKALQEIANNL